MVRAIPKDTQLDISEEQKRAFFHHQILMRPILLGFCSLHEMQTLTVH